MGKIKKPAIEEIKFIRVLCTTGIVMFHFYCHSASDIKLFWNNANGEWGFVLATMFFAISGGVLRFNYPEVRCIGCFYYRRWKSIYPAFYACFLYYFTQNVFAAGRLFYAGNPLKLVLSFLGVDGYFLYRIPNYYIVGEWFLGAIIMLYLIYPTVTSIYNKMPITGLLVLIGAYIFVLATKVFIIAPRKNMITCLVSFCFGMAAIQHKETMKKNSVFYSSLAVSIIIIAIPFGIKSPVLQMLIEQLLGFSLFISLLKIGSLIMNKGKAGKIIGGLDKISYEMFLFQHVIILKFLGLRNPTNTLLALVWAIVILLYIIVCAKILSVVVRGIMNSRPVKRMDRMIYA